jgi:hypothetical protein
MRIRGRFFVGLGAACAMFGFAAVAGAGAYVPISGVTVGAAAWLPDVTAARLPDVTAARLPDVTAARLPDVTTLIGPATTRVRATDRPQFRRDVLYEADGSTRAGKPVSSAAGVVEWKFVFAGTPGSKYASAFVTYGPAPKRFGKVVGGKQPFLEDVPIPKAPTMTLAQALARVRSAGYRRGFSGVTLRDPLGPKKSNPLYIFTFAASYVAVNTVTGKVSVLS